MPRYEVSKGFIPETRYLDNGGEGVLGWLSVGPETAETWAMRSDRFTGYFRHIWVYALDSRESILQEHIARTPHGEARDIWGEAPMEFVGTIPLDTRSIAARGLLYRSGFYVGSIDIDDYLDIGYINRNQFTGNSWLYPEEHERFGVQQIRAARTEGSEI